MTGYRLKEWDLFVEWFQLMAQFRIGIEFQKKIGIRPMDSAPGLQGSLLPRREDSIPNGASC